MSTGILYIVSAPSGAGKTTLVQGLLKRNTGIYLSVSYSTRSPRAGEEEGKAYHFINTKQFETMRERGEFLEWARVHDNYYATSAIWLQEQLKQGHDVLLEIDWQGARQVRMRFPDAVSIFVLPPSFSALNKRLHERGKDSEEVIQQRLAAAQDEIKKVDEFDYVIINEQLDIALAELCAVIQAARLQTKHVKAQNPNAFLLTH